MRLSYIQAAIILSLSGLQQTTGAPIGRYSVQRGNEYGASAVAYYVDERIPGVARIKARGDKDQKQNQLSNKPSSGKPSTSAGKPSTSAGKPPTSAGKPVLPAGKPATSDRKPAGDKSAASSSKRPIGDDKGKEFNPFNSQDPDYPYRIKQPEINKKSKYDGVEYLMFDITKKSGSESKEQHVDQFGFAGEGARLVIKSAENKADKAINGKKATLAELLLAGYKYNPEKSVDPAKLQDIRIQFVQEPDTANRMREVEGKMNELANPPKNPIGLKREDGLSDADWAKKRTEAREKANRLAKMKGKIQSRPERINKFDLSDTSNPELYQKMKDSVWGQSVERISRKFNGKRIVRIHVNMEEAQSFLIFYLG